MNFTDIGETKMDDRTVGLDYKAEYERLMEELDALKEDYELLDRRYNALSRKFDKFYGAVRMIEVITGREFNF